MGTMARVMHLRPLIPFLFLFSDEGQNCYNSEETICFGLHDSTNMRRRSIVNFKSTGYGSKIHQKRIKKIND